MKIGMHKKILGYIRQIPRERYFLKFNHACYTFGSILELSENFQQSYSELINKNCAVLSTDRETIAMYLPAIDNVCNNVFLLPNDIASNEVELYKSAGIDYIVRLGDCAITSVEKVTDLQVHRKNESEAGYILATSGTTGTPKLAKYTLSSLTATAQKNIDRGQDFVWGLTYDINRFAGLQVYLQAIVAGSTLVVHKKGESIDSLINFYHINHVSCLSATPSFWRKVLMSPSHQRLSLKRITLGGEICNQTLLTSLSKKFPDSDIVHIYASTEAGVGFAVKDEKEGFPTKYLTEEAKLKCKLKVKKGLLWIKNHHGCTSFLKGDLEVDSDGFINTGDLVDITDDRVLFLGRESGSINVGGNKVMPEKVESVLEDSPLVAMASVYAKKNPLLGALVSADVVITDQAAVLSAKELKAELIAFCRDRLELFEMPAIFKKVEVIATNATGKKIRSNK